MMAAPSNRTSASRRTGRAALDPAERLQLARELFQRFHTQCFWYCARDLEITEPLIPLVVKGLKTYGGREGFLLAGRLRPRTEGPRDLTECP